MAQKWSGKSRGSPLGYRIFIFLLKHVHIRFAYFIAWFVAAYFYLFTDKKHIRQFYTNWQTKFGSKPKIAVFRNYFMFAKTLLDKVALMAGFNNRFTFEFEGESHLHQLATSGKGGIILGAHSGNWEVAGQLLKRIDCPINVLMFEAEHAQIKQVLDNTFQERNFKVILIRDSDFSHIYEVNNALKKGELIAMHGDRFLPGSKITDCRFLGKPAPFPLGPYYIASSMKVKVCFVSTMKESNSKYHFFATEPTYILEGKYSRKELGKAVQNMAGKYANNLENTIRKYPYQWYNYHNFWN